MPHAENIEYREVPVWVDILGTASTLLALVSVVILLWNAAMSFFFDPSLIFSYANDGFIIGMFGLFLSTFFYTYYADDPGGLYVTVKMGVIALAVFILIVAAYYPGIGETVAQGVYLVASGMLLTVVIYDMFLGE